MGRKPNFTKNLPLSVFEILTYQNAKTPAKYILWRNRIILPKRYILSVFEILTYKKRENGWKVLYIGKQKDITRNLYNECFIVSQELQGKKHKTRVYREVSYIPKC